jgi:hypothetical protein
LGAVNGRSKSIAEISSDYSSLPQKELDQILYTALVQHVDTDPPDEFLKIVSDESLNHDIRLKNAENYGSRIISSDGFGKAFNWASLISDEAIQNAVNSNIVDNWLESNSEEASDFASKLEPGQPKDIAAFRIAMFSKSRDREAAKTWAATIRSEKLRTQALNILSKE